MPKFNHAFDFAFEVKTDHDPDDVTAHELRSSMLLRISQLSDDELREACGCFDSMGDQPDA